MRIWKIVITASLLSAIVLSSLGCGAGLDSAVSENEVVTIQRGNLTVDITAVGNLALSRAEDLAFEMDGTVAEVLVEEAESIEEGQLLAKLDTSVWEDHIAELEDKVTAAERKVTAAERQLPIKQRSVLQAEIDLKNAEIAVYQTSVLQWPEVEVAQADLDRAKYSVEYAHKRLADAPDSDKEHWSRLVAKAEEDLLKAEERLNLLLSGIPTDALAIKRLQVEIAQGKVEDAQNAVEDAQTAVEDAQKALEDAQDDLDKARSYSPLITAPFDGFITRVNVEGGDEVKKGTVAVQIADPNKFEADILVSEMDIFQIKLGGNATVQADAMSGMSFPAKVIHISPTATIQQGVVNYRVKVEVQSLEEAMQEWRAARQEAMPEISSGELPERLRQAIEEGHITQEQVEEMMQQRQQAQGGQLEEQPGQMPTMLSEDFQLREGLTVTVSIIVDERNDVLLVPNAAITTQGWQTYVQVLSPDGTLEQRAIQIGISDFQYTEVTKGLSEAEQVVVPQGTTTTSTTQPQQRQGGGMFIPGMGRPR